MSKLKVGDYSLHKKKSTAKSVAKVVRSHGYKARVSLTPKHYRNPKLPYQVYVIGKRKNYK